MHFKLRCLALLTLSLLFSCKKEVERIVVQDRQYSWAAARPFSGLNNVFLGMGKGPDGLYLQQPGGFLTIEQVRGRVEYQQYLPPISSDVNVRLLIGPNFFVTYHDSLVTIIPNKHVVTSQYYRDIHLRRLDRQANQVRPGIYAHFNMGAINASSYLLFGYLNDNLYLDNQVHFVLAQVPPFNSADLFPIPITTRVITIPILGYPATPSYPTLITAIDNYFLVDCGNQGVYRIEQNGNYRQVLSGRRYFVESFYKWHGRVYAHTGDLQLGISDDDGLTWKFSAGAPPNFRFK